MKSYTWVIIVSLLLIGFSVIVILGAIDETRKKKERWDKTHADIQSLIEGQKQINDRLESLAGGE